MAPCLKKGGLLVSISEKPKKEEVNMKFYQPECNLTQTGTEQRKHYCEIDLYTRSIYLCLLGQRGNAG